MCYKVLCILPLADLEGAGGGEGAMTPLFPSEFFFLSEPFSSGIITSHHIRSHYITLHYITLHILERF